MERLCKNCRFFVKKTIGLTDGECSHPTNTKTDKDLVTGRHVNTYRCSCTLLRGVNDKCGPTGVWFEPNIDFGDKTTIPVSSAAPTPRKAWSFPHMSLMSWLVLIAAEFYVIVESLRLGVWLMNQPNDVAFVIGMLVMVLLPANAVGLGVTLARKFLLVKDK